MPKLSRLPSVARPALAGAGAGLAALAGCAGGHAEIDGSAGGIKFGDSSWVYWGARYVVISAIDVDCTEIDWIERNYEDNVAPTEADVSILQFTFSGDTLETGKFPVAQGAQVQSSVLNVSGGAFKESTASAGTLILDSFEEEGSEDAMASGSVEELTFDDGVLNGSFTAQWCRNLKP